MVVVLFFSADHEHRGLRDCFATQCVPESLLRLTSSGKTDVAMVLFSKPLSTRPSSLFPAEFPNLGCFGLCSNYFICKKKTIDEAN